MSSADDPAFPVREACVGLTKREYAAIQIMAGFAASPDMISNAALLATDAVHMADALFDELDKTF